MNDNEMPCNYCRCYATSYCSCCGYCSMLEYDLKGYSPGTFVDGIHIEKTGLTEKAAKEEVKKIYKEFGLTEDGYLPEEVNIFKRVKLCIYDFIIKMIPKKTNLNI